MKILGYIFRMKLFLDIASFLGYRIYTTAYLMDICSIAHATVKMYIARRRTRALDPFRRD